MTHGWTTIKLGQVGRFRAGVAFPPDFQGRGVGQIPFIKVSDMTTPENTVRIMGAANWVSHDELPLLHAKPMRGGTTVFAKIGEALKAGRFRLLTRPTVVDNNVMGYEPGEHLDDRFAGYLLVHLDLPSVASGSALPYLRASDLAMMEASLPPLAEQRAIADVLGALDDKIESNRRMARAARGLLQAEWSALQALGGRPTPVGRLARFINGRAFTKDATGSGRLVIRIAELNSGPGASTVYNDIDVPEDHIARVGDILMSWSGSIGVYVWTMPEAIVNQHVFKVAPDHLPPWFVFAAIEHALPAYRAIAADKATTMGHINRGHLDQVEVVVPPADPLAHVGATLDPVWRRMIAAEVESRALAALRDALLPELLSGRLRVPEAREQVEAVV